MYIKGHVAKLSALALRGATLALRFGLSFYIMKYLGYEDFGLYGLVLGFVGIVPAAIGWGLNYFISREVVGRPNSSVLIIVRDRLIITFVSLMLLSIVACVGLPFVGYPLNLTAVLIILLVCSETLGLDINQPMIGANMAFAANIVYFIRSAMWVAPLVAVGLYWPETRHLNAVLGVWLVGQVLGIAAVFWFVRKWPLHLAVSTPVDRRSMSELLSRSWFIYLSDLGLVGLIYIDRYIVGAMLGLALTGVYTFYWSLSNALQTLVQTAVVQIALPPLVIAAKEDNLGLWRKTLRNEFIRTLFISLVLSVFIYVGTGIIFDLLNMKDIGDYRFLFILLLISAVLRSGSDLLNAGLTSLSLDQYYAASNIFGIVFSVLFSVLGILMFGLVGAGYAALMTSFLLTAVRAVLLSRGSARYLGTTENKGV